MVKKQIIFNLYLMLIYVLTILIKVKKFNWALKSHDAWKRMIHFIIVSVVSITWIANHMFLVIREEASKEWSNKINHCLNLFLLSSSFWCVYLSFEWKWETRDILKPLFIFLFENSNLNFFNIIIFKFFRMLRNYLSLILLFTIAALTKADTPANCTYEDIRGKWVFHEGPRGNSKNINCSSKGSFSIEVLLSLVLSIFWFIFLKKSQCN